MKLVALVKQVGRGYTHTEEALATASTEDGLASKGCLTPEYWEKLNLQDKHIGSQPLASCRKGAL